MRGESQQQQQPGEYLETPNQKAWACVHFPRCPAWYRTEKQKRETENITEQCLQLAICCQQSTKELTDSAPWWVRNSSDKVFHMYMPSSPPNNQLF